MTTPLLQLFEEVYDSHLQLRRQKLSAFWANLNTQERDAIPVQLDAALSQASLYVTPQDYAFLLKRSNSTSWAITAAKSSPFPPVVNAAIDVLTASWITSPGSCDVQAIVSLIRNDLPQYATARLLSSLGLRAKATAAQSTLVDALLREIYPFLTDKTTETCPLSQYARLAIRNLVPAASDPTLLAILSRCSSQWATENIWQQLAEKRPNLVRNILLKHVGAPITSEHLENLPDIVVDQPEALYNTVDVLMRAKDGKGPEFLATFLEHYIKYASVDEQTHSSRVVANDVIDLATLTGYIAYLLKKQNTPNDVIRVGLSQCKALAQLQKVLKEEDQSAQDADNLVKVALERYARSPEEWKTMKADELRSFEQTETPTGLLVAIFRLISYTKDGLSESWYGDLMTPLTHWLNSIPRPARLPLINALHYANTGHDLLTLPAETQGYPRFSSVLLAMLDPGHVATICAIGLRAHSAFVEQSNMDCFIPKPYFAFSSINGALFTAGVQADLPHALQVGAKRSVFRLVKPDQVVHNDDAVASAIELLKRKASKSREERYSLSYAAIVLACIAQSPALFVDTLSWAFTRYAKDPNTGPELFSAIYVVSAKFTRFIAGPSGFKAVGGLREKLNLDAVAAWCRCTEQSIAVALDLLKTWIKEPDRQSSIKYDYQTVGKFIVAVMEQRFAMIGKIYPTLCGDEGQLREVLLAPLLKHWRDWENFKLVDYPHVIEYCTTDYSRGIPWILDEIRIDARVAKVILPFLDGWGEQREELYREARATMKPLDKEETRSRREESIGQGTWRSFLPVRVIADGNLDSVGGEDGLDLMPGLKRYIDGVLLQDPNTKLDDVDDKLDWHPEKYKGALEAYMMFTNKKKHVALVRSLLEKYKQVDPNPSLMLLQHPGITKLLWLDGELSRTKQAFLPRFPGPVGDSFTHDPSEASLPILYYEDELPTTILALNSQQLTRQTQYSLIVPYSRELALKRSSLQTIHQFTVFVIGWLLTTIQAEIPGPPPDPASTRLDLPATYALYHARVSQDLVDSYGSMIVLPAWLAEKTISRLHPSDIQVLLDAVFAEETSDPNIIRMRMALLGAVRRLGNPGLGNKQAWAVVEDTTLSSWHRHAITSGSLKMRRPEEARVLARSLLEFSREKAELGRQRAAEAKARAEAAEAAGEPLKETPQEEPTIKVSTQKAFVQLFLPAIQCGIFPVSFIEELVQAGLFKTPASVTSYVVQVLVDVVLARLVAQGDDPSVWTVLEPFIELAQRLEESTPLSEKGWDAARQGTKDMPEISDELPIAQALLGADLGKPTKGHSRIYRAWVKHVVEPVLAELVNKRLYWLKTAIARESGEVSSDLEKNFTGAYIDTSARDIVLDAVRIYGSFFTPEIIGAAADDERSWWVWKFMEQRITCFLHRDQTYKIFKLLEEKHGEDWLQKKATHYPKNIASLTATSVEDGFIVVDVRAYLLPVLRNPDAPPNLKNKIAAIVKRVGLLVLEPGNMQEPVTTKSPRGMPPFGSFLTLLNNVGTDVDTAPIVTDWLAAAEEHERRLSSASGKPRGGVAYWKVIAELKLRLARFNAKQAPDGERVNVYVSALADIIREVHQRRWRYIQFPTAFDGPTNTNGILHEEEVVAVVGKLTQAPLYPNSDDDDELRALFTETAAVLIRSHGPKINKSPAGYAALRDLMDLWNAGGDEVLELLAKEFSVLYLK